MASALIHQEPSPEHGRCFAVVVTKTKYCASAESDRYGTTTFKVPEKLLITASKSQSSSPLLSLPMELLLKIFEYLSGNSANQVCLALACKRLLQTSSLVVIEIPSADKHRHMVPPFCDGMLELMRRMDPVAPGVRRQGAALLCWDCLWYLPINKSYWDKEAEKHATMQSESLVSKGWDWRAWDWEQGASLQCPACWLRELDATATREEDRLLLGL